jgi:hypothetical protein
MPWITWISWAAIFTFIKAWLPLVSVAGILFKGYLHATNKFYSWADGVIDKHTKIVVERVDKAGMAVSEMISYHKEMVARQIEISQSLDELKYSFENHRSTVVHNHDIILTGIETIKDIVIADRKSE